MIFPFLAEDTNVNLRNAAGPKTISGTYKNMSNSIISFFTSSGIKSFIIAVVVFALVIGGIGCIVGGESSRERFRKALPGIFFFAMFAMFAYTIASVLVLNMYR